MCAIEIDFKRRTSVCRCRRPDRRRRFDVVGQQAPHTRDSEPDNETSLRRLAS